MGIAATGTQSYSPASQFQWRMDSSPGAAADPRADLLPPPASTTKAIAGSKAVSVELSDEAKAALAAASSPPKIDIPKSLDEILQKRSEALAGKLTKVFSAIGLAPDDAVLLKLDSLGNVATDSPYKKKIEKFFEDDPEAAKELKAVASLSALKAAQVALELYLKEKKAAKNEDEETVAFGRHMSLSLTIQKLSGVMTFEDGKISSVALDYVNALKPPDETSSDAGSRSADNIGIPRDPGN